jgi:nucleoside-diphosphate-sugar epimerase
VKIQPAIHEIISPSSLNTSLQIWYEKVVADSPKTKESLSESNSWVDVRDTALAHVLALEKDAAGGQRIITASGARHVNLIYLVILTLIYRGL